MSAELQKLVEAAKLVQMTPEQQEAQRISFAYGNANLSNSYITKEDVVLASARLKNGDDEQPTGTTGATR